MEQRIQLILSFSCAIFCLLFLALMTSKARADIATNGEKPQTIALEES